MQAHDSELAQRPLDLTNCLLDPERLDLFSSYPTWRSTCRKNARIAWFLSIEALLRVAWFEKVYDAFPAFHSTPTVRICDNLTVAWTIWSYRD